MSLLAEGKRRLDIAAAKLAIRIPFIATIFSGMRRDVDEETPTAKVRGMHCIFGAAFIDALDDEELLFVGAHEAYHTALLHSYRVADRDGGVWNEAGDAVINPELILAGLKMPTWDDKKFNLFPEAKLMGKKNGDPFGVLIDWVKPEANTEEVYAKLMKEQEKKGKGKGNGTPDVNSPKGGWNNDGDLEKDDGKEGDGESEAEVRTMIAQAARTAFASGDKSAMVKRILGVVTKSDIDWKDETRSMLADPNRNDYSYRRFSRRFMYNGLYLPSLYSEDLGTLGVGIDTSGSMTERQLSIIQSELRTIIEDCAPEKVIVVYCDANINRVDVFPKGDEVTLEMVGGGGTDMRLIVDYFNNLDEKLAGVIIFTDLETPFPEQEPDYPFLWGAVNARQGADAPIGRVVEVQV